MLDAPTSEKFPNPLLEVNVLKKIEIFHAQANQILNSPSQFSIPLWPGRDIQVLDIKKHPPKKGLSLKEGRARLLHDLASIELQAFELGVRTLVEFLDAPLPFREELLRITLEEATHLKLCLEGLDHLGFQFGDWPVHLGLWECVGRDDSLIDRVLIVHRYLEGSGLDASDLILRRLTGVKDKVTRSAVKRIAEDEVGHVQFGSDWYRRLAKAEGLDPEKDFCDRLDRLKIKIPRRLEPIARELRFKAGFSASEIDALESVQAYFREGLPLPPR